MIKIIFKTGLYGLLILFCLEGIIRVFHLTKDYPERYVDKFGVEKWVPNQDGYAVTGIRRQNFSEYHINSFGYNSYREFKPSYDTQEIALVGDSFIEGFHQNYYNSIGRKIERRLPNVQVFEFGYAGYDLADQLHLIDSYKDMFDKIDRVIIDFKFYDDLNRDRYTVLEERMKLESPLYKTMRKSKLVVYLYNIGTLNSVKALVNQLLSFGETVKPKKNSNDGSKENNEDYQRRFQNFKTLINNYGFDKNRYTFLLDSTRIPTTFMQYLKDHDFKYLDFSEAIQKSKTPTDLIYDKHWNNHGRTIVADLIANYFEVNSKGTF